MRVLLFLGITVLAAAIANKIKEYLTAHKQEHEAFDFEPDDDTNHKDHKKYEAESYKEDMENYSGDDDQSRDSIAVNGSSSDGGDDQQCVRKRQVDEVEDEGSYDQSSNSRNEEIPMHVDSDANNNIINATPTPVHASGSSDVHDTNSENPNSDSHIVANESESEKSKSIEASIYSENDSYMNMHVVDEDDHPAEDGYQEYVHHSASSNKEEEVSISTFTNDIDATSNSQSLSEILRHH
ncbi:hypothetical protein ROZALSC1DRAFT_29405 [Rozella allomycis CSF55]|uniref:Uncharacterized protein n=1 Tax=Rozella allomycis (strain CSF55) TaxID=988480 RepID=A0A4P9YHA5_ROZAC|nr:hypothetical protein ROZALSC1DRAFT_29405 [Rozella allomycis CSF55]